MTPFSNIYTRAVNFMDDPHITDAFKNNQVLFYQIMNGYLNNAIPLFYIPSGIQEKLNDRVEPQGQIELFHSVDVTIKKFTLTTTPPDNALFLYMANNEIVNATYDKTDNSVIFEKEIPLGKENVYVEWYEDGYFNQDLTDRQEVILSLLLVQCWTQKEKNFLLDIRRLLQDTDFKLISEGSSLKNKRDWFTDAREQSSNEMKSYSWEVYSNSLRNQYNIKSSQKL